MVDTPPTSIAVHNPWYGVYEHLRERILSGAVEPGSRLIETELAEEFGTSRGPVRSALKELECSGLVVQYPRRGAFVRELNDKDIEEIFSLWELIWPFAVRRAIQNMQPDDLTRLEALIPPPPDQVSIDDAIRFGMGFHRLLFILAKHSRLLDVWDNLMDQAQFQLVVTTSAQKRRAIGMNPIPSIFEALAGGDADQAIDVCRGWNRRMLEVLVPPHTEAETANARVDLE
jgi:DNA-binding GntR family transcriptional regulator